MSEMPEAKCFDIRPVPPLGYCAECIREGTWVRAATLWEGTALCAQHLLHQAGPSDDLREQVDGNPSEERSVHVVVDDLLRQGMRSRAPVAAY